MLTMAHDARHPLPHVLAVRTPVFAVGRECRQCRGGGGGEEEEVEVVVVVLAGFGAES